MDKRLTHKMIPGKKSNQAHSKSGKQDKCECPISDKILSGLFSDLTSSLYVLAIKIKGFHWNIVGDQFFPIHVALDCQVTELLGFADATAEIVRQINKAPAPISMREMVQRSIIAEETTAKLPNAEYILPIIVSDYSTMIHFCQKMIKHADANNRQDLSDAVIVVRQFLDKYKWQFDSAGIK